MKFTKKIENFLLCVLLINLVILIANINTLESDENTDITIDPEIESEFDSQIDEESEKMKNLFEALNFMEGPTAGKSKDKNSSNKNHVKDLKSANAELSAWFAASNARFADEKYFPNVQSERNEYVNFKKLESDNFIVNNGFPSNKEIKNKLLFFFRFKNGIIYFTSTPSSMIVLGSIKPIRVQNSFSINASLNTTQTCFHVYDEIDMEWNICAVNLDDKLNWLCSLQKFTGDQPDKICSNQQKKSEKKPSNKKVTNMLIIPTESPRCNVNWNYGRMGDDWQCTCADGLSQSPIDLPNLEKARITKMKPLFIYDPVNPISKENTIDGLMREKEPVKIYNKQNLLRIFHSYLGKIVLPDGGVFHGEEIVFHTPAEHTIEGKKFDLEVQIIHYGKSKGDIAKQVVLSFLFFTKPGAFNKFFDQVDVYNLPNTIDGFRDLNEYFLIPSIFSSIREEKNNLIKDFSFYTYQGSLTYPPCTERTTYFIASKPMPLSNTVIELFKEALKRPDMIGADGKLVISNDSPKSNARRTQPLNGRKVNYYHSQVKGLNN